MIGPSACLNAGMDESSTPFGLALSLSSSVIRSKVEPSLCVICHFLFQDTTVGCMVAIILEKQTIPNLL